jgi:opacity protein-like surface antigen
MKKFAFVLFLSIIVLSAAHTAHAQFTPGSIELRPEFGMAIANSFGISFGATMAYGLSEAIAVGPFFGFATAGRAWEGGEGDNKYQTRGSSSMYFGGRFYYLFTPEADFPWYVDVGAGMVKFGSINEFDDGEKLRINRDGQVEDLEVKGASCFAFNVGSGMVFSISDNMKILFDVNSHIGSQGDRKGKTPTVDDLDLNELFEGGTFWLLTTTVGVGIAF